MTAETEVVEARFDPDLQLGPAVTAEARALAGTVDEVMVTADAVDLAVAVVGEVDAERDAAADQGLAQGEGGPPAEWRKHGKNRDDHDGKNQP